LGGLLHDIGKPLVLAAIVETENITVPPRRIEEEAAAMLIDHLHMQVGGLLAKKWQLADSLSETIRMHDRFDDSASPLRNLVYCGNRIAHHLSLGYKHDELVPSLDPAFDALNITTPGALSTILAPTQEHTERFTRTL
jgi:HD-like signal output (HDOD) protein